jgi:hypothetical protein
LRLLNSGGDLEKLILLSNKRPLRLLGRGRYCPHKETYTFLSSHAVRTLLTSSFFINGLLMFMNVSVNELAFTMWFATTTPGKASCKTKLNYYSLKKIACYCLFPPPPLLTVMSVTTFFCEMLQLTVTRNSFEDKIHLNGKIIKLYISFHKKIHVICSAHATSVFLNLI